MQIRAAQTGDIPFLYEVRNDPISARYSKRGILSKEVIRNDYLCNIMKQCFIVEERNNTIAYLVFEKISPQEAEISIALAPAYRGKGLGKRVLYRGTEFGLLTLGYKCITAYIYSTNEASIALFEKCGYKLINSHQEPIAYEYQHQWLSKVVAFDFDGVIIDSLTALYKQYCAFLESFGYKGTKEEFDKLNGPSLPEIISYLKASYTLPGSEEELLTQYHKHLAKVYETSALTENAKEILQWCTDLDYTITLVTSSKRDEVLRILEKFTIFHYFETIITGEDVKQSKPSPAIYLKLQEHYPLSNIVVVEDSLHGVEAAYLAGLKVVQYQPDKKYHHHSSHMYCQKFTRIVSAVTALFHAYRYDTLLPTVALEWQKHTDNTPANKQDIIEQQWEKALEAKQLSNGIISSLQTLNANSIKVYPVEYKTFVAQMQTTVDLGVRPLAVCSIVTDPNGKTLIGKRSSSVTEYPEYWEFAAAGSIDANETERTSNQFISQLKAELFEETGISEKHIKEINPNALLFDERHKVYDIFCIVRVDQNLDEFSFKTNGEYSEIKVTPLSNVIMQLLTPTAVVIKTLIEELERFPQL